jgi:hypothetical protein
MFKLTIITDIYWGEIIASISHNWTFDNAEITSIWMREK